MPSDAEGGEMVRRRGAGGRCRRPITIAQKWSYSPHSLSIHATLVSGKEGCGPIEARDVRASVLPASHASKACCERASCTHDVVNGLTAHAAIRRSGERRPSRRVAHACKQKGELWRGGTEAPPASQTPGMATARAARRPQTLGPRSASPPPTAWRSIWRQRARARARARPRS